MTDTVRVPRTTVVRLLAVVPKGSGLAVHLAAMLAASPQGEGSSADDIGHELIAFANQIEGAPHDARAAAVQFFAERIARRVTEGVA